MRPATLAVLAATALALVPGCKKKGGTPGPGPGGWLVGDDGLMAALTPDGSLDTSYELGTSIDLTGIACRGATDAFVVGEVGTFLRTFDGGETWESVYIGTPANLRAVAADTNGSVLVAAADGLWLSRDSGAHFASVATGNFSSVAMSDAGTAIAVDDGGIVWRVDGDVASFETRFDGARVVAAAHRDWDAVVAGDGGILARSRPTLDRWQRIAAQGIAVHAAWVGADGVVLAARADGAIVEQSGEAAPTVVMPATDVALHAIHIDATGAGLAAGDAGTVLATDDAGATWRALDLPLTTTIRGLDQLDGDGHW